MKCNIGPCDIIWIEIGVHYGFMVRLSLCRAPDEYGINHMCSTLVSTVRGDSV